MMVTMKAWRISWWQAWLLGGMLAFPVAGLGLMGTGLAWELLFWNRIYPGVHVGVVDLSGLTREAAEARLREVYAYPEQGRVTFTWQDMQWETRPLDLGLVVDYAGTAEAAWRVGREGPLWARWRDRWQAWTQGVNVPLRLVFHPGWAYATLTNALASRVEEPPQDAFLALEGASVQYRPGRAGRRIAWSRLLPRLAREMAFMQDTVLDIPTEPVPPVIPEAQDLAQRLEKMLSRTLRLTLPDAQEGDPGPWDVPPEQVAAMLRIVRRVDAQGRGWYELDVDPEPLRPLLRTVAAQVLREPVNARFTFNEETRELELLEPAVYGRRLKTEETLEAIVQALKEGRTRVPLMLEVEPPRVTDDATAEELGIRELIVEHTTYFYGSSAARMHNIRLAGSRFHGYLVAPGEVFSMAQVLGDISLDNGYAEAPIIFGNRTIQGVGGGVCQVSTTLFRTVFFGGYPIVERHPHSYRVYYYELEASGRVNPKWAGLDATVYVPIVDFKFKNDTPYWILMEVEVNIPHRYIRWRFYSTSDGREVVWDTTGLQNKQPPPPPRYIENPELKPGEIRQTDWPIEGGTVTVVREVYRNGELLFRDVFTTHYRPWPAICEYGPGTEGMPPENPDPDNPCKP